MIGPTEASDRTLNPSIAPVLAPIPKPLLELMERLSDQWSHRHCPNQNLQNLHSI